MSLVGKKMLKEFWKKLSYYIFEDSEEITTKKPLCIYHGNCADGFAAAVIIRMYNPDMEFYPGIHGEQPPDVTDREVIMLDFSYKKDLLEMLAWRAKSILILDHHKSAEENLKDLPENVATIFDMNRSGAMITWEHCFPNKEPPRLLKHIQDRDLWKFELEGTQKIQAALFSYPYDFDLWENFFRHDEVVDRLCLEGCSITRKHFKDIEELLSVTQRTMLIGDVEVPVANLPYTMSSDACHIMLKNAPFAACYYDTPKQRRFSLRSSEKGMDVSKIASLYGGGGHKHAAGFEVHRDHPLALA